MPKPPRKRIKLECQECGSQFDDDYKSRHEAKKHNGKHVPVLPVKHVGAPSNPFEASKRKSRPTPVVSDPTSSSVSSDADDKLLPGKKLFAEVSPQSLSANSQQPPSEPPSRLPPNKYADDKLSPTKEFVTESSLPDSLQPSSESPLSPPPKKDVDDKLLAEKEIVSELSPQSSPPKSSQLPSGSSLQLPPKKSEVEFLWITFSGKVSEFLTNLKHADDILKNVQNEAVPNLKVFFVNMKDCLKNINKESEELLQLATEAEGQFSHENFNLCVGNEVLIDHDPGKRQRISSANQRKYLCSLGPYQPKLSMYPTNADIPSNKHRQFSPTWYAEFPLLEYSPHKDAAFCFACILFPEGVGRIHASSEWVSVGVRQWHKMKSRGKDKKGKLIGHFTSESHLAALSDFSNFVNEGAHIDVLLDKNIRESRIKEEQEREYHLKVLQILVDVVRTLGRQGLAFRGHEESPGNNDGNFQQIVNLISRHCPLMNKWLEKTSERPHHVTYLSPDTQNDFIDLLGTTTEQAIVNEVNQADIFSIMADTTPDLSHRDRLAVNIRYVIQTTDGPVPIERLLKMDVVLTKKTGEELAEKIFVVLQSMGISVKKIMFQSYDFASNMSGKYNGTQKKLSEKCGKNIHYIPCQAHRINIFVETACNASVLIKGFFNDLEALYVFFSGSTKRFQSLREVLKTIENSLQIQNLSKTRWTARAETVKAVWIAFESIVHAMEEIKKDSDNFDNKTRTVASGLLKKLLDFDFICSLYFCKNVMFKVKNLTEKLEAVELNVVDALVLIRSTSASLQVMNNDEQINALIESSVAFAEKLQINPENDFSKHHRTRRIPKKYDENPSTATNFDFLTFYRKEFKIVFEVFTHRIEDSLHDTLSIFEPIQTIFEIPMDKKNITFGSIESVVQSQPEFFREEPECLLAELRILVDSCKDCENFSDISKVAFKLKNVIPLAFKLVCFVLTSPVTSASCERSFSKLKLVYNHLRTTMGDLRLNSLMLLFSSKDQVDKINLREVVEKWSLLKHRRVKI